MDAFGHHQWQPKRVRWEPSDWDKSRCTTFVIKFSCARTINLVKFPSCSWVAPSHVLHPGQAKRHDGKWRKDLANRLNHKGIDIYSKVSWALIWHMKAASAEMGEEDLTAIRKIVLNIYYVRSYCKYPLVRMMWCNKIVPKKRIPVTYDALCSFVHKLRNIMFQECIVLKM